jgi:hypothetical protein
MAVELVREAANNIRDSNACITLLLLLPKALAA